MSLLIKSRPAGREIVAVTPEQAGWQHVGFRALRLAPGERESWVSAAGRELCLVVLSGTVDVAVGGRRFEALGVRSSVFEPVSPAALYIPPDQSITIEARSHAEIGLASAPSSGRHPLRLLDSAAMPRSSRGHGSNTRHVCDILPHTDPGADHLLVVEVLTPAAHSSSYPPHKHDRDDIGADGVHETRLEETYYHRVDPPQGFGFQRVYTDDRSLDEAMAVEDHDLVLVPRGYHPVVAPHGYRLYYLNVMAGPTRHWVFRNDPAHEWMLAS
jgi:5-deoxy-glucuronate isomerase